MKYRSHDITRLLAGVYMRMHRRLDTAMAEQGASLARTKLLLIIGKHDGAARAVDLAEFLGQAPRTVTEALDGLQRDGLIERVADEQDRRVKRLRITDAGRRAVAATEPLRQQLSSELLQPLTNDERDQFGEMLEKLIAHIEVNDP